jgi:type IV pilus assembly protein PilM
MKNSLFGLDIGATSMKAVWLSQGKAGYLLNAAALAPTPAKGMTSESPLDQQELANAIKKMLNEVKITTPYVALALPESQVYTRVIEMPVLSDKELTSAIAWEAEQYIPVPLANLTIDHTILKRPSGTEAGTSMQVLLVGAPNTLIDKYSKLLTMAGLVPVVMETEVMAVARALASAPNFPNALLIHIGAMNTVLSIVKDGVIVFTFPVPTGGIAINRAIATDYGFSFAQAEEYKKVYGVSDKSLGGKIGQTTAPILMAIISEVKKAISYYNEKYKNDSPIQQILLSGGSAKLPGINTFFAQNAGIEAVIANPWNILGTQQVPPQILENATDYTIAVGLAMRTYE